MFFNALSLLLWCLFHSFTVITWNLCRTDRVEKVLEVLLGEIGKLEQDEALLKTMEKDLTVYHRLCFTLFPLSYSILWTFYISKIIVCCLSSRRPTGKSRVWRSPPTMSRKRRGELISCVSKALLWLMCVKVLNRNVLNVLQKWDPEESPAG